MANNSTHGSDLLAVPPDKMERAKEVAEQVIRAIEDEPGAGASGLNVRTDPADGGVLMYGDENFDPEQAEYLARTLIEELELDEPFYCSWAHVCDKPRPGEFGGGAFVIRRGFATFWCDARQHVMDQMEHGLLEPLDG